MPPAAPVTAAAAPRIAVIESLQLEEAFGGKPYTRTRRWATGAPRDASADRRRVISVAAMSISFLLTSLIVVASPGTVVLYLLYMAWQALHERGALAVEGRLDERSARGVIVTGFLINILNPKLSIFFLAFLPQFIAADETHPLLRMLQLSGVFMAMTFVVFVLYGLFAAAVRDRVVTRPRVMIWLRRAFAGGFALLGMRLAFAAR
jgi:hypothetical protein